MIDKLVRVIYCTINDRIRIIKAEGTELQDPLHNFNLIKVNRNFVSRIVIVLCPFLRVTGLLAVIICFKVFY